VLNHQAGVIDIVQVVERRRAAGNREAAVDHGGPLGAGHRGGAVDGDVGTVESSQAVGHEGGTVGNPEKGLVVADGERGQCRRQVELAAGAVDFDLHVQAGQIDGGHAGQVHR